VIPLACDNREIMEISGKRTRELLSHKGGIHRGLHEKLAIEISSETGSAFLLATIIKTSGRILAAEERMGYVLFRPL
jgi:hypothetical protein